MYGGRSLRRLAREDEMDSINILAVVVAAIGCFVASGAYYAAFSARAARYSAAWAAGSSQPAWKIVQEPFRAFVTAATVAIVAAMTGVDEPGSGAALAAILWVGFPAMLLTGSVIHENVPWQLAIIHAGDWLLKLLIIGVVVGAWR
jgi:hypothetical protein